MNPGRSMWNCYTININVTDNKTHFITAMLPCQLPTLICSNYKFVLAMLFILTTYCVYLVHHSYRHALQLYTYKTKLPFVTSVIIGTSPTNPNDTSLQECHYTAHYREIIINREENLGRTCGDHYYDTRASPPAADASSHPDIQLKPEYTAKSHKNSSFIHHT